MKSNIFLFIIFLFIQEFNLRAQNSEEIKLAQQFMQTGEYEKAKELFEEAYNQNPNAQSNYKNYYNCLFQLKDIKEIEKITQKQIKKNTEMLTYYVDLGKAYGGINNKTKMLHSFDDALSKISNNRVQVQQLANAFLTADELSYAIKTYEIGREKVQLYSFQYELANLYYKSGNLNLSLQTYLNYLTEPESNFQNVCNALTRMLDEEKDHTLLQELIFERIQKKEDVTLTELLIWDYVQLKDFDGAFIQVKALDKRLKEDGERLNELAELAKNEKNFDAAISSYTYIVSKGKDFPYYFVAKNGILNCQRLKIELTNKYTQADIDALKKVYASFLSEYNRSDNRAANVILDLASLEAFYSHRTERAIQLLDSAIQWQAITVALRNEMKLALGDFYLISNDVWESTLIYSQVDKAMKDDPLGEMARFKNAKLAYYRGDFESAQGQLNVLKASTSELVANDALKLSIFITENLGLDTVPFPMMLFAKADLLLYQNLLEDARNSLQLINQEYPGHKLQDDILFMQYQMALKEKKIDSAMVYLQTIRQNFAFDLLADDAIFNLAEIYQFQKNDLENAKLCYEQIILNYKDSLYVTEARKRYRTLRGDQLN